jgi:hypothetical protein
VKEIALSFGFSPFFPSILHHPASSIFQVNRTMKVTIDHHGTCSCRGDLTYEEDMTRGKVQVVRLASSLYENGDIIVQSIDFPINDEHPRRC